MWHILIFIISCKYQYYPIFQIRKLKPSHAFPQDHMVTGKMATQQVLRIWLQRLYSVIYKVSHLWKVIQPLWASISISVTVKREEYLSLMEGGGRPRILILGGYSTSPARGSNCHNPLLYRFTGLYLENTESLSIPPRDSTSGNLEWGPGIYTLAKLHMKTHSFAIPLKSILLQLLIKK